MIYCHYLCTVRNFLWTVIKLFIQGMRNKNLLSPRYKRGTQITNSQYWGEIWWSFFFFFHWGKKSFSFEVPQPQFLDTADKVEINVPALYMWNAVCTACSRLFLSHLYPKYNLGLAGNLCQPLAAAALGVPTQHMTLESLEQGNSSLNKS